MNVQPHIELLQKYVEAHDFAGYDPYDALNSPFLKIISSQGKWFRIAVTQAFKRSPVNLRPLFGVQRGHNPKGIGLFLWSYSKMYTLDKNPSILQKIEYLLDLLDDLKCNGYSGNCWGYNFDWQSRTFLRPAKTPTIVNTSFIGHALLDCYEITGIQKSLDLAIPIKDFIMNDLNRTRFRDTFCFSYTPVDTDCVHNANMLGASILLRLIEPSRDRDIEDVALTALSYSMSKQRNDGSWYYAENSIQNWIDSFHTGFNLQALRFILDAGFVPEYQASYFKGVKFYAENFFLPDGTPKYYHDRIYPIDIHAPCQAVTFLSGMGVEFRELTDRILNWMLKNMLSNSGYFYFQKNQRFTNRISYMRWSQSWAMHALTEYQLQTHE